MPEFDFQVPKELKQRIQDYFQTMWSLNHGIDMGEVREHLATVTASLVSGQYLLPY